MGYYEEKKQKSRPSDGILIVRIFVSFFLIVLSIFVIYKVVIKVSEIKILEKINLKPETHDSINITTDTNSGTTLFITDEKGLKFRKEDKTFAREEWIEKNGELFYFDTAGYGLNGDLKNEGQIYTFENGKLKNIKRDMSYVHRADDNLYSSVKSAEYLVWLDDSEKEKNFYPIRYSLVNADETDYLGTAADKQYASPNMLKIYMSNIYYLAVGKSTSYAGRLYRMRPNAIHKETVGVGVTGFIVLSDDIVYYCDGDNILKAKNWRGIELKLPENEELNEDGEIIIKTSTPSSTDLENNENNSNDININNLPNPDETTEANVDTSNLPITESTDASINSNDIVSNESSTSNEDIDGPVIPIIGSAPIEDKRDQVAPIAIEVEAPR
ncbi:MAG: hypothetical protein IJ593_09040 [Lachnospiraceae bacterium]|nr:hypothetical protein [Lachnospiraceae bacterium]